MPDQLNAVALHYFRLPRHTWELALTRMKQLGAETLYTPVVWGLHEFADNKFDLLGLTNPRKNIAGFIDLGIAMDFKIVLDFSPGLLLDAQLLNGGLPGWLVRQYPDIMIKDRSNKPTAIPSPENPTLLKFAGRWFQAFGQALAHRQVSVQISLNLPITDYSDHVARVQWPIWLRKRYAEGGVEALNAAYTPAAPYRSLSQVELSAQAENAAFRQDVKDFSADLLNHARLTYTAMLQEQGCRVIDPITPPIHGIRVNPDPADVGASFRWAMDAPVRADGSVLPAFWQIKAQNLQNIRSVLPEETQVIYSPAVEAQTIKLAAGLACFRLLLNGKIEPAALTKRGQTAKLTYWPADNAGQTDFYFTLPAKDAPFTGYPADYLSALLAAQTQTIARCLALLKQLTGVLEPAATPAVGSSAPALSEAQAALTQANQALHKAAASIGALEDVFAAALDKPLQAEALFLVPTPDAAKLGRVKQACQNAVAQLQSVSQSIPPTPLTVKTYTIAQNTGIEAAASAVSELSVAHTWLREGIATGSLPPTAWAVHAQLEIILHSLSTGIPFYD